MALNVIEQPPRDKAVFIDKDGTLVPDVPYNVDPRRIRLMPGAGPALQRLSAAGYRLIVVSNQSGIARGLFKEQDLMPVNQRIQALLAPYGMKIDAFYYCPHSPADGCECRKPRPGMFLQAARNHGISLKISWMIGDILNDVEAGNRVGCRTIHLNNGSETEWQAGNHRQPSHTVNDWLEAISIICPPQTGASRSKAPSWRLHRD